MKANSNLRLEKIRIQNFKAIEDITLEFPLPRMLDEPDVFLLGSKNGVGKTSILEAITFLFVGLANKNFKESYYPKSINLTDILIRSGCSWTSIESTFSSDVKVKVNLSDRNNVELDYNYAKIKDIIKNNSLKRRDFEESVVSNFYSILLGFSREPFVCLPLIYFHSYRKTQEGSPEFRMMFRDEYDSRDYLRNPISSFKIEVLRSLMNKSGLFEGKNSKDAEVVLDKLNDLIKTYANGYIDKLKPSEDNTIDFRITSLNKNKDSFSFDSLSSGQKEIISTLFLIWYYTRNISGIVLIDEPELHLNAEWHKSFINTLFKLAPNNQYIISTHSEEIFSSVDKERRILLIPDEE